jgi:hypothetical protein
VHDDFVGAFGSLSAVNVETTRGDGLHDPMLMVQAHSVMGVHTMTSDITIFVGVVRVSVGRFE